MSEPKPVAWLQTMHMEGGQKSKRLSFTKTNAFGRPGKDYSAEYRVTIEPLYLAPPAPAKRIDNGTSGGKEER